jgi:DNA-binding NarL/FixJ family response regulator
MGTDHIQQGSPVDSGIKFRSGIFIYAEAGVVFQGLMQSLQRTFPDIRVSLANSIGEPDTQDGDVGLVLLHADFAADVVDCIARCKMRFPNASVTLMIDENSASIQEFTRLFDSKTIQGLLPFNLKLDVWLAVVWLLLNGGDYYPSNVIRSMEKTSGVLPVSVPQRQTQPDRAAAGRAWPVKTLTLREHEILQLLSEGLQNKIIADRLTLSIHTVKVHVHNLIRKLRAHNRTQATAIYRNSMNPHGIKPFDTTAVH